jgi:alkyl sulfatase BDS1-like metallo-beta-lactamase superfamily hydrolase
MVNAHFGERPVTAVLYTHSHTDHFGGILGVVTEDDVAAGRVPIYAPEGFLEAAVSENIIAGTAMLRRATYMYGALIPKDELGHVDTGLGKTLPAAPGVALVAPTHDVTHDLKSVVLDGVEIHFQLTPGTEAPAEMNMWLPQFKALCLAENCTANFHNLYTLRGAQVRDALAWSKYTHQALREYGNRAEVAFASHHWPRWGSEISTYLEDQRDLYRYVHDQTMRLANHGATMKEIAEEVVLPEQLANKFYLRDYYGTVRHNAKAVYQRYLGWFDANPATLNPHPPVVAAQKYVAFMGGAAAVMEKARESFDEGDYRWAAEVMNHVVFAEPENEQARFFQADILEQLGYQSESGPWRDFYLTGAQELRSNGTMLRGMKGNAMGTHMVSAMSMDQVCDLLGIRVNGPLLAKHSFTFNIDVSDRDEKWCVGIRHGALYAEPGLSDTADFSLGGVFAGLTGFVTGNVELDKLLSEGLLTVTGATDIFDRLCASLDSFSFGFDIVLP